MGDLLAPTMELRQPSSCGTGESGEDWASLLKLAPEEKRSPIAGR